MDFYAGASDKLNTYMHHNTSHNKGQAIVEAVLLLVLFISAALLVQSAFRERGFLSRIIGAPWTSIKSMVEKASWSPKALHPNHTDMHTSTDPKKVDWEEAEESLPQVLLKQL